MKILIYKINSSVFKKSKWKLVLPLEEAKIEGLAVTLRESHASRMACDIQGKEYVDEAQIAELRRKIARSMREEDSPYRRRYVRSVYAKIDELQFSDDFVMFVADTVRDYRHAAKKGFVVNGIHYVRLLGTTGGIKQSTIMFVKSSIADEMNRRIDNDRDMTKTFVPAKLEAYRSLVFSGSYPVSMPKGLAVVDDCVTKITTDAIVIANSDSGRPTMEYQDNLEIEIEESDGYGIMLPSLAERWSQDLGLDYVIGGCNTRFAFEKGMVFAFDFLEFADEVAGTRMIKDAWGNDVDLSDVELILTTSMVKLWDSYENIDDYIAKSLANGYTFGVPKYCPEELDNERTLNYQFIQSYELDDADVDELIEPTINEIADILGGDWRKTLLFLGCTEDVGDYFYPEPNFVSGLMVNHDLLDDKFVRKKIYELVEKRIDRAKVGVVNVHGNYSTLCGDPYALCQSLLGLEVTGLLGAGEIYNKYWDDAGVSKVACFRAPMTNHNSVRMLSINRSDDVRHWYRHIKTATMLNAFDTTTHALNGADKDGDLVFLTDNRVLVDNHRETPAIICEQKHVEKILPTEQDMIESNIAGFGDDIGKITNRITSMFEVASRFPKDSDEWKELDYRIHTGQLFQQDAIDKIKGIVAKPMPQSWYSYHAAVGNDFDLSILADKKPYFMRYIYPGLMREYNRYISNANKKALRLFRLTADELEEMPSDKRSDAQEQFLSYFYKKMPLGMGDYCMNNICRKFEDRFDGKINAKPNGNPFNYSIYKSGCEYIQRQYNAIKKIYDAYTQNAKEYYTKITGNDIDDVSRSMMVEVFRRMCHSTLANEEILTDIIIDMCYKTDGGKQFAWDMVGDQMVRNMMSENMSVSVPTRSDDGDVYYGGYYYDFVTYEVEVDDESGRYHIKRDGVCTREDSKQ